MNSYRALGAVYDRLMDADFGAFADFYEESFRRAGISPELLLDLGCGTGVLTLLLSARGYDMIGVDGSPEMLSRAYERKTRAGDAKTLFLQQDLRGFELYGTVGAVISSMDSVGYLTEKGDLLKCFSLVHNYLDPDGLFIFDVNTPYKFEHIFGKNAYILEGKDCYCGWQNNYSRRTHLCRFDLSVFRREKDGKYRREDETQLERCYSEKELRKALSDCGFVHIEFFGDLSHGAPTPECERWFVCARCKK